MNYYAAFCIFSALLAFPSFSFGQDDPFALSLNYSGVDIGSNVSFREVRFPSPIIGDSYYTCGPRGLRLDCPLPLTDSSSSSVDVDGTEISAASTASIASSSLTNSIDLKFASGYQTTSRTFSRLFDELAFSVSPEALRSGAVEIPVTVRLNVRSSGSFSGSTYFHFYVCTLAVACHGISSADFLVQGSVEEFFSAGGGALTGSIILREPLTRVNFGLSVRFVAGAGVRSRGDYSTNVSTQLSFGSSDTPGVSNLPAGVRCIISRSGVFPGCGDSSSSDPPVEPDPTPGTDQDLVASGEKPSGQICSADPVNLSTGEFFLPVTDVSIPGFGPNLEVSRTYRSQDGRDGLFGYGWHSNLTEKMIEVDEAGVASVVLCDRGGIRLRFEELPGGRGPLGGGYRAPPGVFMRLIRTPDGGFRLSDKVGTVRLFNADGLLTTVRDRVGNVMSILREEDGFPVLVVDASGRAMALTRGADGRIAEITDPAGRTTQYGYDAAGNLVSVTDPSGGVTTYVYDTEHNMLSATDARGIRTLLNEYDGRDRVVRQTQPEGVVFRFFYDSASQSRVRDPRGNISTFSLNRNGNPTAITDPLGRTTDARWNGDFLPTRTVDPENGRTDREYDSRGNLIREVDAAGGTTFITYEDRFSQPTSIRDPGGNRTRLRYDDRGLVTEIIDAEGARIRFRYNARGLPVRVTDARDNTTRLGYDAAGNLVSLTDPLGNETTFTYDVAGNRTSRIDPHSNTTTFAYDALSRLTRITNPDRTFFSYTYDAVGNLTSATDENGNTTAFAYDGQNRLTTVTDALGGRVLYGYDPSDNLISITNELGNVTRFVYNARDELIRVTDPLGNQTRFSYDPNGNLKKTTDALRRETAFGHDALDRLIRITDAQDGVTRFRYDANGNLTRITDANGNATTFTYDALNRQTAFTDPLGNTKRFKYDGNGNLIQVRTRNGERIRYRYDATNRLVRKILSGGQVTAYTYDAVGNLTEVVDPDSRVDFAYDARNWVAGTTTRGSLRQPRADIAYAVDGVGNVVSMLGPDLQNTDYVYDALDRLIEIVDPDGGVTTFTYDAAGRRTSFTHPNGLETTYEYDAADRLLRIAHLDTISYTYDPIGNRTSKRDGNGTWRYTYDALDQLIEATHPTFPDEFYEYDPVGNRTASHLSRFYRYDAANRLLEDQKHTYRYDDEGNQTRRRRNNGATTHYRYDAENRLFRIAGGDANSRYRYDGLGRRIEKIEQRLASRYIYDGDSISTEYNLTNSRRAAFTHGPSIDEPLSVGQDGSRTYYSTDAIGSITGLSDSVAARTATYTYDSFGRILSGTAKRLRTQFAYTGREFDNTPALYFYRARYYDPLLGRFLKEDPLRFTDGVNLFRYVGNVPTSYTDPSGMGKVGFFIKISDKIYKQAFTRKHAKREIETKRVDIDIRGPADAGRSREARKLARELWGRNAVRHDGHNVGWKPHYQHKNGGRGHIFYTTLSSLTFVGAFGDTTAAQAADLFNPFSDLKDILEIVKPASSLTYLDSVIVNEHVCMLK